MKGRERGGLKRRGHDDGVPSREDTGLGADKQPVDQASEQAVRRRRVRVRQEYRQPCPRGGGIERVNMTLQL